MTHRPRDPQPRRAAKDNRLSEKDRRDADDQSGSTGRNPGTGDHHEDGADSGQDRYGMTGGADRNAPTPGHEAGSSGTSEYGGSDYGEPGDHERGDHEQGANDTAGRDAPDDTRPLPSRSQPKKSSGPDAPSRNPSKQRQQ